MGAFEDFHADDKTNFIKGFISTILQAAYYLFVSLKSGISQR